MSYNFVTVSVNAINQDGSSVLPAGQIALYVSDLVWDTAAACIVFVDPIELNAAGGVVSGPFQVPLLAMDNTDLSTNWFWVIAASAPGVGGITPRKLTVDFANGATQNLTALLATSAPLA